MIWQELLAESVHNLRYNEERGEKMRYLKLFPFLFVCIGILFLPTTLHAEEYAGEETSPVQQEPYVRGKILEVTSDEYEKNEYSEMRFQKLKILITSGEFEGEIVDGENNLDGYTAEYLAVQKGDKVLLQLEKDDNGQITAVYIAEMVRDTYLVYLIIIFILALLLVGGLKGFKALLGLIFTILLIWKGLLPLLLKGYNPILLSVVTAIIVTVVTLFIINGFHKKTYAAIVGTMGGVICAGIIALIIGGLANLHGLGTQEAQMLVYLPQEIKFDFRGLLFAGIILGALGAVMDVSMSIASAVAEVEIANPDVGVPELFRAGINVGKDIMGTMSNTLILAYTGATIHLLLLFMAYDIPFIKIINLDMIASEVLRALAGTIGLIFTIPITAIVAASMDQKS